MSKLHGLVSGILVSVCLFMVYMLDYSATALANNVSQVHVLAEEVKMIRNYKEYNKVKSNNYVASFCSISHIIKNPMQFALFFLYKNETLSLINKVDEKRIIVFISECCHPDEARKILDIQQRLLSLFVEKSEVSNMACEMLLTIIRRMKFDTCLYHKKTTENITSWFKINKFILDNHKIFIDKDLDALVKFVMIYKLSEVCYV